MMGTEYRCWKW